jgi:hypothetical protein
MFPNDRYILESATRGLRRRLLAERSGRPRAVRFEPSDWPRSRGPTPNPRRH